MEVENLSEYSCSQCSFSSQSSEKMKIHAKSHGVIYSFGEHLEEHNLKQKMDSKGKRYSCPGCDFQTDFIVYLKEHSCQIFACSLCQFKTRSKDKYKVHKCGQPATTSQKSLTRDNAKASSSSLQSTGSLDLLKCSYCNFESKSRGLLRLHSTIHEQVLFNCSLCNFSTAFENIYKNHKLSHSEKKFRCSLCPFISTNDSKEFQLHCQNEHNNNLKPRSTKRSLSNERMNTKRQNLEDEDYVPENEEEEEEDMEDVSSSSSKDSVNYLSKSSKYYTCSLCAYKTLKELNYGEHLLYNHQDAMFTTLKNVLGKERLPAGFKQNVTPEDVVSLLKNVKMMNPAAFAEIYAKREKPIHWALEEKKELYWCAVYAKTMSRNGNSKSFSKRRRSMLEKRGIMNPNKLKLTTDARFNSMVANIRMNKTKISLDERNEIEENVAEFIEQNC